MMRFLRNLFGCGRREAAHDEDWQREKAARAELQARIEDQVRQIEKQARNTDAAARLIRRLERDVTQC